MATTTMRQPLNNMADIAPKKRAKNSLRSSAPSATFDAGKTEEILKLQGVAFQSVLSKVQTTDQRFEIVFKNKIYIDTISYV